MKKVSTIVLAITILIIFSVSSFAQEENSILNEKTFSGLKWRSVGPALMSGRIADIAINPFNESEWYIAVGSGGVWKTTNAGVTWKSIFDDQPSYSIGCLTIDPQNQHTIWVGTGENVGGRHVGYGDGIYKSMDGGESWENMGLKESHHISKIIVHPENSEIIWVAAQGPLWNKGGERGLYKSVDGGVSWNKTLGDDEWTGVTDIVIDTRNPDVLYAATWQRHRNVAAYMGGGPGSGLHRSVDGGETWTKLTKGLPSSNMGKIGLAISPQNPDVLYAAIELDRRTGAVFRSENRGESWQKQSETVSGATGPHYYQELYASPHEVDRIYLVDVRMQISDDGGKNFRRMKEQYKHSDNHAIDFKKDDPNYLLVGTDGGLYESFDLAENWRFIQNLPLTQFYKVALDDSEPFYKIYGGTQDNNTQGGPSRTNYSDGILNSDWFVVLGGDGHQPATEPGNPNILYAESQEGFLSRIDLTNGEVLSIQPQPEDGEVFERFNWDSPILVSPHNPSRIYFASQRVWRSDNRGDSWKTISGDLTKNQERLSLPIMEDTWSWDSPWDIYAMSNYNTITSLAESPLLEGLIYAGTDDGSINITEDGGTTWKKIEVSRLPGVPATAFVNDIKADLFDVNTVYVVLDNHKYGDLEPYVYKSVDRGKSWQSIKGNLPSRTLVWRLVQDHIKSELLFTATEFGVFFTIDGGNNWIKLSGGLPTISFRDIAIQKRENDLVGATFGRGFYVLDDYSMLREFSEDQLKSEAALFSTRKAWWYIPNPYALVSGASAFTAPNPEFGAVFTYYLKEEMKTKKEIRQENEKQILEKNESVTFPGWDKVEEERRQDEPKIWLIVKNNREEVIRRIPGINKKGINRTAWNLRYPPTDAVESEKDLTEYTGAMVAPGEFTVTLSKEVDGIATDLSSPQPFTVERMYENAIVSADPEITSEFWKETERLNKSVTAITKVLTKTIKRVELMQGALKRTTSVPGSLDTDLHDLRQELLSIDEMLNGNRSRLLLGEKNFEPTIRQRLNHSSLGSFSSTHGPTETMKRNIEIAGKKFNEIKIDLELILNSKLPSIEKQLMDAGAPWIEGQPIPDYK